MKLRLQELEQRFQDAADSEIAAQMSAYMRDQFPFYGIKTTERRKLYQDLIREAKKSKVIDWSFLKEVWEISQREAQYFVCDYLRAMEKYLVLYDIHQLWYFIKSKQWWDTIDSLDQTVGQIGLRDERLDQVMLDWAVDEDLWVRRLAINHQRLRKDKMNVELLDSIIRLNLGSEEFFINKAIGWILRDYSKTNPTWVEAFLGEHQSELSTLSYREASKHLKGL